VSGPEPLLHAFFAESVRRWPHRLAIDVPPAPGRTARQTVTYAELARHAGLVARAVRPLVCDGAIVAILAERDSPAVFAAQLGVLQAGAAYTCIDPAFPDEQVREILADAEAVVLLADARGRERTGRADLTAALIVDLDAACAGAPDADHALVAPAWLTPRSLAYVIYTSGTTGRPKGVMIEHASIANLVSADLDAFGLGPGDRVAQSSSLAYDSSIEETWLALASGATLVVADERTTRLGPDLVPWLRDEQISVLCPPPTLLRTTGCADPATALPHLRLLYVGGEALPEDVARQWSPRRALVNGYGPTEATVTAIRARVGDGASIPIGRPVAGVQAWVLDDVGVERPDGERGELCLGGIGLARGYRNLPELTAAKFPTLPGLGRVFRTGDLAHREADGEFFFHGRIDALVKLRGYRIELEAIEARLSECVGVREAACAVRGDGARQLLAAFVVPDAPASPPDAEALRGALARVLPGYMVPARIEVVSRLPTTVGGKLDRARLPSLDDAPVREEPHASAPPATVVQQLVAAAFQQALQRRAPISIHDDFFRDLGGDSLGAALVVSSLREQPATAVLATRDVYEAPTVAGLADRAAAMTDAASPASPLPHARAAVSAWQMAAVSAAQGAWLAVELVAVSAVAYLAAFRLAPWLLRSIGLVPAILLAPVVWMTARALLVPVAVMATRIAKALLVGRYRPMRVPAWGGYYVRHWVVQRVARFIPWQLLAETEFLSVVLRALGARVGERVHIHRGVDVSRGGWDLLVIGNDVTLARDASLRLVDLDDGHVVIGAISVGAGATLDVRAGMGPGSSLAPEASLTAWSSLPEAGHVPEGERWDGIPAAPSGRTGPPPRAVRGAALRPLTHAAAMTVARAALWYVIALPFELAAVALLAIVRSNPNSVLSLPFDGAWRVSGLALLLAAAATGVPLVLLLEAAAVRLLGPTSVGVISRWSPGYIRVWLKTQLLESAGTWLSGTLFWPTWLRAAGMTIGAKGEISTIIDTVPDLVSVGDACFLADGIYLAGPRIDRGTVTLARVVLGARTFVGNHAVISCGQTLPDDVLLGVCTVADTDHIRPGSAWVGHPPLDLPRREDHSVDRRLTHNPPRVRYWNRVFWELLRCSLPVAPMLVALAWVSSVSAAEQTWTRTTLLLVAVPGSTLASGVALCALVLAMKWLLLGRVRPGTHPLWSCWCSRWDFLYVAWAMYARVPLSALEGTVWLSWYLRAMGMTIGRGVLLGPGFSQVVDPDMLVLEDGATVSAMFQAHTFEDRVLKIGRIHVRRGATVADGVVPLYGADIGAFAHVAAHSLVLKGERLTAATRYEGAPAR